MSSALPHHTFSFALNGKKEMKQQGLGLLSLCLHGQCEGDTPLLLWAELIERGPVAWGLREFLGDWSQEVQPKALCRSMGVTSPRVALPAPLAVTKPIAAKVAIDHLCQRSDQCE